MASGQLQTFLRHLRRTVPLRGVGGVTDAQLLERFVLGRDAAAFEVLVWRHGPMVHNVCRRVLHREHDAEDAFQATFLALARKAAGIGKRESVGSWLYKVAYRVALRARAAAVAQPLSGTALPDRIAGNPVDDLSCQEMRAALVEEVARLPEKYRAAFVLCQLEGRTTESAARRLGCPRGTISTRLTRARELLRRRLARRGIDLSALAAAEPLASLPAVLVETTIKAALFGTAEQAAAAGVISARVAALTKGAVGTMSLTKFTLALGMMAALSVLGGAILVHQAQADQPAATAVDQPDRGVVLRWKFEKDRPFYQELTTETTQNMLVADNKVVQSQAQTFYFSWTPLKEQRDTWTLKQKILGAKVLVEIGGNKMEYDSTKEADAHSPLADFYKSLVGAELKVTLDKETNVPIVERRDELVKKLAAANPILIVPLNQVVTDDALRHMAETAFAGLPEDAVRPGDSWKRKSKLDMGSFGTYRTTAKYTYTGRQGNLDRIKIESKLEWLPPDGDDPKSAPKQDQVKGGGAGTLLFDRDKGRIVSLELTQKLEGKLPITAGNQAVTVDLSQTQKTTLKTADVNPLKPTRPRDEEIERLREENERLKRQLKAVEDALRREGKPKE
jgi:RNA polymerase sigma factor (sigma-70 family)